MYAHCIHCTAELGGNEVIEQFPVGRKLAFDSAKGRLWVVCRRCARWNLSPLEERFEAIEALERAYSGAKHRVTSDNIGMAVLPEGLELVCIGAPQRRELAIWRYGRTFLRRRRRHVMAQVATWGTFLGGAWPLLGPVSVWQFYRDRRIVARVSDGDHPVDIQRRHAKTLRLAPADTAEGWAMSVDRGRRQRIMLHGSDAVRTAGLLLPHINEKGADDHFINWAVREIERSGTAESFIRDVSGKVSREGLWGPESRVAKAPRALRLALEMAAQEESEYRALQGELALLEAAWKEAEQIAAIADSLLIPASVTSLYERMRASVRDRLQG